MTRYHGVKCATCGTLIALAEHKGLEGKVLPITFVPLEPIACSECGSSRTYAPGDSLDFDGPEGLLPPA